VCGLGGYVAGRLKWRWSNYWVDGGLGASAVVWPQRIFRIWYQRKRGDDDLPSFGQEGMKKAEDKPKGNERGLKNEESGLGLNTYPIQTRPDQVSSTTHRESILRPRVPIIISTKSSRPPLSTILDMHPFNSTVLSPL